MDCKTSGFPDHFDHDTDLRVSIMYTATYVASVKYKIMVGTLIQSIPASVFEWILVNVPAFGILLFMAWCVWKYISWLVSQFSAIDKKFTVVDTTLLQHSLQTDGLSNRTTKLEAQGEKLIEDVHKVQTQLAVLDMKMEQKFEKVDQHLKEMDLRVADRFMEMDRRFNEIDRKLDKMDKRFESFEQKFEAQNQFNLRMLSVLESTIKNNPPSPTNPDLRIQKT